MSTGRFALPLGIKLGIESAKAMIDIARKREIVVHDDMAEKLPFAFSFDFVLMVKTLYFMQDHV